MVTRKNCVQVFMFVCVCVYFNVCVCVCLMCIFVKCFIEIWPNSYFKNEFSYLHFDNKAKLEYSPCKWAYVSIDPVPFSVYLHQRKGGRSGKWEIENVDKRGILHENERKICFDQVSDIYIQLSMYILSSMYMEKKLMKPKPLLGNKYNTIMFSFIHTKI